MPNTFERNINLCFLKIKRLTSLHHHHHRRGHPQPRHHQKNPVITNYNSLYEPTLRSSSAAAEPDYLEPDLANAFASQRFFFSSPGRSKSIFESTSSSSLASSSSVGNVRVGGGFAVPTFSPDPFLDFRRSMQEMVEARDINDVRANWDGLHELLTCYLALNPKSMHKFIVGAFADLLVNLMTSGTDGGGSGSF